MVQWNNLVLMLGQKRKRGPPRGTKKVSGVVTGGYVSGVVTSGYGSTNEGNKKDTEGAGEDDSAGGLSNSWKLNAILAVVSCWFAMTMTSWGSISSGGNDVNPNVGRVSMWMIISAQWLYLALYLWTIIAPRLFPDRDFS